MKLGIESIRLEKVEMKSSGAKKLLDGSYTSQVLKKAAEDIASMLSYKTEVKASRGADGRNAYDVIFTELEIKDWVHSLHYKELRQVAKTYKIRVNRDRKGRERRRKAQERKAQREREAQ